MKRLKILTILIAAALGAGAGTAYAQFAGGSGGGWGLASSGSAVLNDVAIDTNIKIIRAGQGISGISEGAGVVNVTLGAAYPNNNLKVGQKIVISGTANYNGTFTISTVTDQSHFSYVQTSTSRATETAGTAGGDYTSLTTWDSDGANTTAECYNDWEAGLSENLNISGNTTSETSYKKIVVPLSERNTGTSGTGFKIAGTVTIGDNYAVIEDIEATGLVTVSNPATLTVNGNILFGSGLTVASGATLNAGNSNMTVTGTLYLAAGGTVNAQGSMMTFKDSTANFITGSTFNPGQASLTFSGASSWTTPSVSYKTVRFASGTTTISGTPYIADKLILDTGSGYVNGGTINLSGDLVCNSGAGGSTTISITSSTLTAYISGPAEGSGGILPNLTISKAGMTVTAFGPLTFQNVNLTAGTLELKGSSTFTVVATKTITVASGTALKFTGTSMSNMLKLRSSIPETRWNLSIPVSGASVNATYADVQDCNGLVNGTGAPVAANTTANVNSGNNLNWNFGSNITWIADTAQSWSTGSNWSGGVVPTSTSNVFFSNAHSGNCTLTGNVSAYSIASNGYTGILSTSAADSYSITVSGDWTAKTGLYWNSGTFQANSSIINVKGYLNLYGGTSVLNNATLNISAGTTSILSDIPAFHIMNCNPGSYIYFNPGSTVTVASGSTFNAIGDAASGQVALRSGDTANASYWNLDNQAGSTVTAYYMTVGYSKATNPVTAVSSAQSNTNVNWSFGSGYITAASVVPTSLAAGVTGKVTASFTPYNPIPADYKVEITFPADFDVSGAGFHQSYSLNGTFSSSVFGQTVTITRAGGTAIAGYSTPVKIILNNIKNPMSPVLTGPYTITAKTSAGAVIDTMSGLPGNTIVPNPLSALSCSNGTAGTAQDITWTSATTLPASVNIKYSTDGGATYNLIAKVANATGGNSYSWIPRSVLGAIKIRVEDADNPTVFVASGTITIAAPDVTTIVITSPTSGEELNTETDITWTPTSAIGSVKIEYSADDGETWATVAYAPNSGTYHWNLDNYSPSTHMQVRVTGIPGLLAVSYTGGASGKVTGAWLSPSPSGNANKVLGIKLSEDFNDGDTLTLSGLKVNNFAYTGSGQLGLDVDNNTDTIEANGSNSISMTDDSVFKGGSGAGGSLAETKNY